MYDLKDRVVLLTGGSRGIGAACARALSAAGAEVALHFNSNRAAAEKVREGCIGRKPRLFQADFSKPAAPKRLWERAAAWKGRVDVLVNNAGVMSPTSARGSARDWQREWERTLQVNLIATAALCREAIKMFRRRGGGIVINVASRAAFRGDDAEYMHYAASKAGMVALGRSMARAYAKDGILVYTVSPGFVDTEMNAGYLAVYGKKRLLAGIPLGAFATPRELAHLVAFLASGLAPSATGANIDVNGASYVR